jgi:hypothetical protein
MAFLLRWGVSSKRKVEARLDCYNFCPRQSNVKPVPSVDQQLNAQAQKQVSQLNERLKALTGLRALASASDIPD